MMIDDDPIKKSNDETSRGYCSYKKETPRIKGYRLRDNQIIANVALRFSLESSYRLVLLVRDNSI